MNEGEKAEILRRASRFFKEVIVPNHLRNTEKLTSLKEFRINPFLVNYLAAFLEGDTKPKSLAKVLILPRILGTSINTSFGQNMQPFISDVLKGYGSATSGIDIEYTDAIDKRKKYCQLKAGPDTINSGDVDHIAQHFKGIWNRARTNRLRIQPNDLVVCIIYGRPDELNAHYQRLSRDYTVLVGQDFWYRLTGDKRFYSRIIGVISAAVKEVDSREVIEKTIDGLAADISRNPELLNLQ